MRIASITIGLDEISTWKMEEQVRLPEGNKLSPVFLPEARPLTEILHRPTLNERLPDLLQPELQHSEILLPNELSELRKEVQRILSAAAFQEQGANKDVLKQSAAILMSDVVLDEDLRDAMAALLQG